jgi:hypothetical protein
LVVILSSTSPACTADMVVVAVDLQEVDPEKLSTPPNFTKHWV